MAYKKQSIPSSLLLRVFHWFQWQQPKKNSQKDLLFDGFSSESLWASVCERDPGPDRTFRGEEENEWQEYINPVIINSSFGMRPEPVKLGL